MADGYDHIFQVQSVTMIPRTTDVRTETQKKALQHNLSDYSFESAFHSAQKDAEENESEADQAESKNASPTEIMYTMSGYTRDARSLALTYRTKEYKL